MGGELESFFSGFRFFLASRFPSLSASLPFFMLQIWGGELEKEFRLIKGVLARHFNHSKAIYIEVFLIIEQLFSIQ